LSVVSVKVSSKTKKEMEQLKDRVEWPAEIRIFIEGKLEQARREETLQRVEKLLQNVQPAKPRTASRLVRKDRDSGH
jgi:hypothetical protein